MGWDGMGWDGMGWDGMGWDEMVMGLFLFLRLWIRRGSGISLLRLFLTVRSMDGWMVAHTLPTLLTDDYNAINGLFLAI